MVLWFIRCIITELRNRLCRRPGLCKNKKTPVKEISRDIRKNILMKRHSCRLYSLGTWCCVTKMSLAIIDRMPMTDSNKHIKKHPHYPPNNLWLYPVVRRELYFVYRTLCSHHIKWNLRIYSYLIFWKIVWKYYILLIILI